MARDHARLYVHIWTDPDFIELSAVAKLIYLQLFSQPKLAYSGVLDLAAKRWARAHPDLDLAAVRSALAELDAARFIVVDQETEEVLVRSFIRRDELWKQPNVLRGALRVAFEIVSPILRVALARELRRLPVEVTGPAPLVAADELEAGARELPASVMAAMDTRTARKPATGRAPRREPVADTTANSSANPSGTPSAMGLGEGSGERETGVSPLALRDQKVGDPARTSAHPRPREDEPAGTDAQDAGTESGSARQARRAEAERLVTVHCPAQPQRVVAALRGQVIGLLREGIEPAVIAAGLRVWAGKSLPPRWLPELVGELMRARRVPGDTASRHRELARELATAQTFEQIRADAVAEDDCSPLGLAVRGELPAHADAATLQRLLDQALAATVGTDTGQCAEEEHVVGVAA
ncbi:hypothetical protein FHX81_5675 [Saccharothrix saharensis]|uniref:Uncharacterized protein n=1 Tax=Saccharothrix saharensis TaxID=571190 RepID=A0A543JK75_9PSEU|nr:hypothetical protein [Saccharothrix saharensis]TQM83257.1 hypothetical protein FHX81_5675 [Saccharothrix saharensis]